MLEKRDNLNRLLYINLNGVERIIYRYYGNTNITKFIIRLFAEEQTVEVFNKKGKLIYSNFGSYKFIKLKNITVSDDYIKIKLPKKIKEEYIEKIKTLLIK